MVGYRSLTSGKTRDKVYWFFPLTGVPTMRSVTVLALLVLCPVAFGQPRPTNKPLVISPKEAATLGDFKWGFKTDTEEYEEFGKKYDGQIVSLTGYVFHAGESGNIHFAVTWRDAKQRETFGVKFLVKPNNDGTNIKFAKEVLHKADKKGMVKAYYGKVVGEFHYDPASKSLVIKNAILHLTKN